MPNYYEVQIKEANTINELDNIKQKIMKNYSLRKERPSHYSKLMISTDDKKYLMNLTVKDAKDKVEDKINNAYSNMIKWKNTYEDGIKERNELHKNPIILLTP
jgi:hypothetical protein